MWEESCQATEFKKGKNEQILQLIVELVFQSTMSCMSVNGTSSKDNEF